MVKKFSVVKGLTVVNFCFFILDFETIFFLYFAPRTLSENCCVSKEGSYLLEYAFKSDKKIFTAAAADRLKIPLKPNVLT
jgi:hypothetical protein